MLKRGWTPVLVAVVVLAAVGVFLALSRSDGDDGGVLAGEGARDCGTFVSDQVPGAAVRGFECAAAAFAAGEPARLEVTFPTDEGAPVKSTFETDGEVIRVRDDYSRDPFSDGGVGERECYEWNIDLERGEVLPQDCVPVVELLS